MAASTITEMLFSGDPNRLFNFNLGFMFQLDNDSSLLKSIVERVRWDFSATL